MSDNVLTRDNLHLSRVTMALQSPQVCEINCTSQPNTVADYIRESLAENTRVAYLSDLAHFEAWGGRIPASPETIAEYLVAHADLLSVATLNRRLDYIWADGIHLQARLEDEKQCILVLIGATPEGRKELVGFTDGARESAQDWRDLLLDLKRRGLDVPPRLAIADGALGFWKAAGEVWPKTREQRCWVHKTANVIAKLPKSQQPKAKRNPPVRAAFRATTLPAIVC